MGQKVNPNGFRLGISKKQNANWYAKGKDFSSNLIQDLKVRDHLNTKLKNSSISKIELERTADTFIVNIHTARPGIIIGKRGEEIENLKKAVEKIVKGPSQINIKEVKKPELKVKRNNVAEVIVPDLNLKTETVIELFEDVDYEIPEFEVSCTAARGFSQEQDSDVRTELLYYNPNDEPGNFLDTSYPVEVELTIKPFFADGRTTFTNTPANLLNDDVFNVSVQ